MAPPALQLAGPLLPHRPPVDVAAVLQPYDLGIGGEVHEESGANLLAAEDVGADLTYLPLLGSAEHLVIGWSHLLAGYPRSGKTELLIRLAREWLDVGYSVLYMTEDPRSMWKARLKTHRGDWSRLQLVYGLGSDPIALHGRAFGGQEEIVVVDTIRNLLRFEDENDNSEVARKVNPWIASARTAGKTPFMAHHMRKGSGRYGEGIAGGHALLGAFEIALELVRDGGQVNRRILRPYCRLISPPEVLYEMTVDGSFRLLGSPESVSRPASLDHTLYCKTCTPVRPRIVLSEAEAGLPAHRARLAFHPPHQPPGQPWRSLRARFYNPRQQAMLPRAGASSQRQPACSA